jgi:hypothetical protein
MPDANGLPTVSDCLKKIDLTAQDDTVSAEVIEDVQTILTSVIAAFQAPFTPQGDGGTGRRFEPLEETRYFNGNGRSELQVPDIVPDTDFEVKAYGQVLDDVLLKEIQPGQGYNLLYRPAANGQTQGFYLGQGLYGGYGPNLLFPDGTNNIEVTATWGFAATAPKDVYEAIRCEVCRQTLIMGLVGLDGVGEDIEIGDFHVNTGQTAFASPLDMFKQVYERTVKVRRFRPAESVRRNQKRMR